MTDRDRDARSVDALARLRGRPSDGAESDEVSSSVVATIRREIVRRASRIGSRTWIGVGVAAVVGLGVVIGVVEVGAIGASASDGAPSSASSTPPTSVAMSTTTSGPTLVVHASGAVRTPGVYRLAQGARVIDLLEAAGGPAPSLDLDRLNLAAPLLDGSRIWFPVLGVGAPSVESGSTDVTAESAAAKVDLNRATATQLDALPGVGPTTAAAIVAHRTLHGPFRSVDDLLSVKGLGSAKVESLRPLVTVG